MKKFLRVIVPVKDRVYTCLYCGCLFQKNWIVKSKNKFCSKSCSSKHRFSIQGAREMQSKKIKTISLIKKKQKPSAKCISCSSDVYFGKYCNECKSFCLNRRLFQKLNIDNHIPLKESGKIAKKILINLYFDKKMSMLDIQREYGINLNTLHKFCKKVEIDLRNISDSLRLSFAEGRSNINENRKFKKGWHTNWNGKKIYYRSSYEYNLCKELDSKRVNYEMESLRISYFDSQKKINRTALPDFYLVDSNEIIEVKSDYFFNKENMKDKFKAYIKLGYKCKLILESIEYDYDSVMKM